jgi:hypothetical protein
MPEESQKVVLHGAEHSCHGVSKRRTGWAQFAWNEVNGDGGILERKNSGKMRFTVC